MRRNYSSRAVPVDATTTRRARRAGADRAGGSAVPAKSAHVDATRATRATSARRTRAGRRMRRNSSRRTRAVGGRWTRAWARGAVMSCAMARAVPSLAFASSTPCPRARAGGARETAARVLIACSVGDGDAACGRCLASALTLAYGDGFETARAEELASCALASFGTIEDDATRAKVMGSVVRWCVPEFWRSGDATGARRTLARWGELRGGGAPNETRLRGSRRTSTAYVRQASANSRGRRGPK